MSHFSVLVIGKNPEDQLAVFDENIEVPEYLLGLVTDQEKKDFMCFYKNPNRLTIKESQKNQTLDFEKLYKKYGREWNNNSWRKNSEEIWCKYSTYNTNSKWDWYKLGGRWLGFFKLKAGFTSMKSIIGEPGVFDNIPKYDVDQTLKKYVDFKGVPKKDLITFAILKDGVWYEKGDKTDGEWRKEWEKLVSRLSDNILLSVFDCHI